MAYTSWFARAATLQSMAAAARNQPPATPRYIAIAAVVRDRIATEQLGPHTLLPSERELAEQHGVSRMTARQALSLLQAKAWSTASHHEAPSPPRPRVRFHIGSFSEEVSGPDVGPRLVCSGRASAPTPAGGQALGLEDRRMVNSSPAALRRRSRSHWRRLPARGSDARHPGPARRRVARPVLRAATASPPVIGGAGIDRARRRVQRAVRRVRGSAGTCSPVLPKTTQAGVWNTRVMYRADRRPSKFPNSSAIIGSRPSSGPRRSRKLANRGISTQAGCDGWDV